VIKNILILTFENLSNDKKVNYLCNSVPIEVNYLLSNYKHIRIITTNSGALFEKKLNEKKKLKIDFLLKGSFLKVQEHIRFNIQLIDNNTNTCLLSAKFEENYTDIFDLINNVSVKIIQYLDIEFKTKNRKIGATAYENYLKGLQYWNLWNESDIKKAIKYFNKTIKQEAEFSLGYARLSHCYSLLATIETLNNQKNYNLAKSTALKAIELDNSIVEAHLSLALIKLLNDIDILGAYYSLEKAFSLNNYSSEAHYYYGFYLLAIGKYKNAIKVIEYALEEDPFSIQKNSTYGFALSLYGKYDLAENQLKKVLSLNPDSIPTYDALIWNYILNKQFDQAKELIEQNKIEIFLAPATQIVLYHNLGLFDEVKIWKNKLDEILKETSIQNYNREASVAYLKLGDTEKGITHFEAFYKQKKGFIRALTHPAWKAFRESDKFYIYKKRLKLLNPPILPKNLTEIKDDIIVINSHTSESISIPSKSLLYIESQSSYSKIVYVNESNQLEEKILRTSLTKIMYESLQANLYRCHNSFIINTDISYSVSGNKKSFKLHIKDYSITIPVTRSKVSQIYQYVTILN